MRRIPAPLLLLTLLIVPETTHALEVPVRPEEPNGYPGNPSTLVTPLRQNLTTLEMLPQGGDKYDVRLGPGEGTPEVRGLDLRAFIPRVSPLARGNETLTRIALFQREFNRNDTRLGPVAGADEMKLANNCLRGGLWEVILEKKTESGGSAMQYHGWFDFPAGEYGRVFEQANGLKYDKYKDMMERYPELGGLAVPLKKLRRVERESRVSSIDSHAGEPVDRLPEQTRKAGLLLSEGIRTYGDFVDPGHQPIVTASFSEPGYYNREAPVKFDLGWLGKPKDMSWRRVRARTDGSVLQEIEVRFANGYRLIVADAGLTSLAAGAPPKKESEALRLTFGIGTPEIYATLAERMAELASPRPNYLLLLDSDGRLVDNHKAGMDRVYVWREAGEPGKIHLWVVSYERIALLAHLSAPWAPPAESTATADLGNYE